MLTKPAEATETFSGKTTRLYPVSLKLDNKMCLVVGGGDVARRKVEALLKTGATLKVVGRDASAALKDLAETGRIALAERDFIPSDVEGAFLVVAATDDEAVNRLARDEAVGQGALINVVDQPELCDFFVPAVVERGRLQVAVSTGGASPAFAKHLRERLEDELGPEFADYLEVVSLFRRRIRDKVDKSSQNRAYARLFASDLLEQVKKGAEIDIDGLVEEYASGL